MSSFVICMILACAPPAKDDGAKLLKPPENLFLQSKTLKYLDYFLAIMEKQSEKAKDDERLKAVPKSATKPMAETKITRLDVPPGWTKKDMKNTKTGVFIVRFQRTDYKEWSEKMLSTNHETVVIVGNTAKAANDKMAEVVQLMRRSKPRAFRMATPVDPRGWVVTQVAIDENNLSENGILRARGEASTSHQQIVTWLQQPGRARLLAP